MCDVSKISRNSAMGNIRGNQIVNKIYCSTYTKFVLTSTSWIFIQLKRELIDLVSTNRRREKIIIIEC